MRTRPTVQCHLFVLLNGQSACMTTHPACVLAEGQNFILSSILQPRGGEAMIRTARWTELTDAHAGQLQTVCKLTVLRMLCRRSGCSCTTTT